MEVRPARGMSDEAPRVLIVDDDPALRDALATVLRDDGTVVDVAASASEAARMVRRRPPGIALVDLNMPDIDGWEVIRLLRTGRPERRPHIIVMSGLTDASSRRRAFELGCDQYVVKEAGADALVAAVRTYILRASS